MGFFSWKTQDTKRSIANIHSSRDVFTVYMKDNKGNVWKEDSYDGYGVIGGIDFYQLLAEMNNAQGLTGDVDTDRLIGIKLFYGEWGLESKLTGVKYIGGGKDFFDWKDELIHDGMSANQLLEIGDWKRIKIKKPGVISPNLVEDADLEWVDEFPDDCPEQGFFYGW